MERTQIQITVETRELLKNLKQYKKESYNDIILRLIKPEKKEEIIT